MDNKDNTELKDLNEISKLGNEAIRLCLEGVITQEEIPVYRKGYLEDRERARLAFG